MQVFYYPLISPVSGRNKNKEVSDMRSDVITMPKSESFPNDTGCGERLFAYACGLSGKDHKASSSSDGKAKKGSGITGLYEEFEKTKLDS